MIRLMVREFNSGQSAVHKRLRPEQAEAAGDPAISAGKVGTSVPGGPGDLTVCH
jgi:hypothetical protein